MQSVFRFIAVLYLFSPLLAEADEVWIVAGLGTTNEEKAYERNNVNTRCDTACRDHGTSLSPKRSCNNQTQNDTCFNGPADPSSIGMQQANCCCTCLDIKKDKVAVGRGDLNILNLE